MNTVKSFLIALGALTASSCGPSDATVAVPETNLDDVVASISADSIRAHLEYLADDRLEGRMTGERGYEEAGEYVAAQFEALGLEPGGDEGGWYQSVTFQSYQVMPEASFMVTHRDGADRPLVYWEEYLLVGDPVRETKSVRAQVVLAGYGVHAPEFGYSDFEGIDVSGKILAVFYGAPELIDGTNRSYFSSTRTKKREAAKRGAVGLITLPSRRSVERLPWERLQQYIGHQPSMAWLSPNGDASGYVEEILGSTYVSEDAAEALFAGTPISFEEARDAADAGTPASMPLGFEVTMQTESRFEKTQSSNVIGVVRGTDPQLADEYVVYTAHLDHVGRGTEIDGDDLYNGAYDNAMGVALMLEAARVIAINPPRRSVMFVALTAEEHGLLGSDYFVTYPTVPASSLVANVNLDMPLFLYPLGDLVAFGAEHSSLMQPAKTAAENEGFALTPDPIPEENLFARSDQYSFVRGGIPAIYLVPGFTSLDPEVDGKAVFDDHLKNHYHRPSDDLSRPIDWPSAERFARANARIGILIGNADARPSWNEGNFYGEKYGREATAD
jgi:hypothetical protein